MPEEADDPMIGITAGRVKWSHFRSYQSADLELRRLTVLLGTNNSGKSSLHRPLVLMKQTLEIDSPFPGLHARGPLVDCGSFDDCSFMGRGNPITFRIELQDPIQMVRQEDDTSFAIGGIELSFGRGNALNPFVLTSFKIFNDRGTRLLERKLQDDGSYDYHGLICKGNPLNSQLDRSMREQIATSSPSHFLFDSGDIVPRAFESLDPHNIVESDTVMSQLSLKYMAVTGAVQTWAKSHFARTAYIGPMRAIPKRSYRLGAVYQESDSSGLEVPEILFRVLSGEQGFYRGTDEEFSSKLATYLSTVGLKGRLETTEVAEDAFSLFVEEPTGARVNLADSAFGYSQVLPLIVRVLLSVPGDTLIVEQPELHLNPALQGALADVFVQGVSRGSTAIIETHSEHFLNRLRFLVADEKLDPADLAIYFVDRGPKQSRVRRIGVDEYGAMETSWPKGFFGDSLRQARELNRAQVRRKARVNG